MDRKKDEYCMIIYIVRFIMIKFHRILIALLSVVLILSIFMLVILAITLPDNDSKEIHQEEVVVKKTTKIEEKKDYYQISEEERELLARLVHCEASICSNECKYDVISVVFNRLEASKWGDTLEEVIYYKNAFTPAASSKLERTTPTKADYAAVDYVLENGPTLPTYVRYFRTDYDFRWEGYQNYKVVDNVYFGYLENWQNGAW